jgi:hypothetical protein
MLKISKNLKNPRDSVHNPDQTNTGTSRCKKFLILLKFWHIS